MSKEGYFLNQDILILTFHPNLRTTVPFVDAHLQKYSIVRIIPKSDLYFTFCSTLNALSKEHQSNC